MKDLISVFLKALRIVRGVSEAASSSSSAHDLQGRSSPIAWVLALGLLWCAFGLGCGRRDAALAASASLNTARPPTFSHDVARVIYHRCTPCHRPGQSAPFDLITYRDVHKHAAQFEEVLQNGLMPPWLPDPDYGDFLNPRRLAPAEKDLLLRWIADGSPEGDSKETPPPPTWPGGWTLGKPDLVVQMETPYVLGPEGPDVYRNFIIPVPLDRDRYVRAFQFVPGNSRIVHHAFLKLDTTRACRRLDGEGGMAGFSGMDVHAEMPDGQFLAWQPGKVATQGLEGMPWRLPKSSDLILQAHLNRTGKAETLQSSVALYFTDRPPTNSCFKLALLNLALDIPAGDSNYLARDSFQLPIDVDVLAVLPHAHYLAKQMEGYAVLPAGSREPLLRIRQWDFRWQGDYRYAHPVYLPAGSELNLAFTYDNSTNNLYNSGRALRRVFYGPQASDEMCELWFQIVPRHPADLPRLKEAYNAHVRELFASAARHRIEVNPNDAKAFYELGVYVCDEGRVAEGLRLLDRAIALDPTMAKAHVSKGTFLRLNNRLAEAKAELETALRLDPRNARAYGHLGFVYASQGNAARAKECFQQSLALNPDDPLIQDAQRELQAWKRSHPQ